MTRTLARRTALRRFISLWVTFAFVLSMTNVSLAVPAVTGDEPVAVVEQVTQPEEAPVPDEVSAEPVDEAVDEPPVVPDQPVVEPAEPPVPTTVSEPVAAELVQPSQETRPVTPEPTPLRSAAKLVAAASVTPVTVGGNPALTAGGIRIDEQDLPGTYTHTYQGIEIEFTVTVTQTEMGEVFSFTSDYPVAQVVVKGGNVGANIYTYPASGVYSDTDLHAPVNPSGKYADISHLDFYFVAPVDLEVVKYHDLDADGTRDAGEPTLSGWTFEVRTTSGTLVASDETGADGSVLFEDLAPGTYTITESAVDDWVVTTDPYPVTVTLPMGETSVVSIGNVNVADVEVAKFNDLDGDAVRDEGEPLLDGWTIRLLDGDTVVDTAVTADGVAVFEDVLPGAYAVDEILADGWVNTTVLPVGFALVGGQDVSLEIGNQREDVTKTFELTYAGAPALAEMSAVYTLVDGSPVVVTLEPVGDGLYSASVDLPYGAEIDSVVWRASIDGELYILGVESDLGEVLTADVTNAFTYTASISGSKFGDDDADGVWDETEGGLAGWTIGLYRAVDDLQVAALPLPQFGYELVAETVTGADGSYSFTGLLPGTYYVAEEMQDGWFQTVAPEGVFEVADGIVVVGADFGNAPEGLPFTDFEFDKAVDREVVSPGQIVQYTLTYTLTEDSDPWTEPIPIVDDYDERYLTPVDVGDGVVDDGTITWIDNDDMAPGETRMVLYSMRVDAEMPVGTTVLPNVARLDVLDGFVDEESVTVTVDEPVLPFTEFEFDKRANRTTADPGDLITYTLTYTLTEDSDPWTDPVRIVDDYDERYLTPVDIGTGVVSDGTVVWIDNADMAPGETRVITYTMRVDAEMPVGTTVVDNTALLDVQAGYEDEWTVRVRVDGEPFLPFTGGELMVLLLAVAGATATGAALRRAGRSSAS